MYVNIGGGHVIESDSLVGIFDLDITSQSAITRNYLNLAEKNGRVINAAEDIPKSFIVCNDERVYLSQPSPATLLKREEI